MLMGGGRGRSVPRSFLPVRRGSSAEATAVSHTWPKPWIIVTMELRLVCVKHPDSLLTPTRSGSA